MVTLYQYKGTVNKVYDGDTITDITIDLGFGIKMTEQDIRLFGIDTAELRDSKNNVRSEEEKVRATEATRVLTGLTVGQDVTLKTFKTSALKTKDKKEKYGRWLALIHVPSKRVESFFGVGEKLDLILKDSESGKIGTSLGNNAEEFMCVNDILVSLKLAVKASY